MPMPQLTDQDVIKALRTGGPQVVNDLRKTLKAESFVVGATLSTLLQKKFVKQTHHKKGTSCYYYLPGQEPFLEKLTSELNAKDQPTVAMLKEKQVVRDRDLELFERVSLRNIKDYAKEVVAQVPGGQILFWRYYLLTEAKAIEIIKERYWHVEKPNENEKVEGVQEEPKQTSSQTTGARAVVPESVQQESKVEKIIEEPAKETKPEPQESSILQSVQIPTPKPVKETQQNLPRSDEQIEQTEFFDTVISYFKERNIKLITQEQITKGKEYSFVVDIPSQIGTLRMYCRARNKKKLNEGDVAPALLKAKQLDYQLLFLTSGQFTKKGLKLIEQEYKGVIIEYLE